MLLLRQLQGKKWLFYSAGPLDGEIAFAFLGCKMDPGSWAEAFDVMKHIKPVICKRCVWWWLKALPLSSAMPLHLLCRESGSAEPCWGPRCFWGGNLQRWPLQMSPPLKGFCGVGPAGACPTAKPCMHPTASHGKQGEGINISTNFWTGSSWGQETIWASESSHQVQGRNMRQPVLRAFSCFQYFALTFSWWKHFWTEWQKWHRYGDPGSDNPAGRRLLVMRQSNSWEKIEKIWLAQ